MDNVIQNINISDIIPSNFQPTKEEKLKIEKLATLIKQFGLLDPILVRPKNSKYEIILGLDKYQASLIANQTKVPVIIKDIDDETYSMYSKIDNRQAQSLNSLPKETFSKQEENSDVINLSELSKIKLEDERDDVKMNNGQFNNMNNNLGQPSMEPVNQGPTFGGRFFPSLEDEPTNMNMISGLNEQPTTLMAPPINNNDSNNNLIDLTDLSIEKEIAPMTQPNFSNPTMNIPNIDTPASMNLNLNQENNFEMPTLGANPIPMSDTIINLDSLQNNNLAVQTPQPSATMEILNADFGAPNPVSNQFNTLPNIDLNIPQTQGFNIPQNPIQPESILNQVNPSMLNQQPMPSMDINPMPTMQTNFSDAAPAPMVESNIVPSKDVTPVTNTIKNLVNSLAAFGYKINIVEEDLLNTAKIIIEVEK
jgi:hypothetical protein